MPAIVEIPQVARDALDQFADLFANAPQRRHFAEYLTGLIAARNKTVSGINSEFVDTTNQSCLNRFLTKAEHRIEECIQRAKSEAELADYEVRNWKGWHHHQDTFTHRHVVFDSGSTTGKKSTPAITVSQIRKGISDILRRKCKCGTPSQIIREREQRLIRNELARLCHWKQRNCLASLNINKRQI